MDYKKYNKWLNNNINGFENKSENEINLDYVKYFYFNIKNIIEKNKMNIINEKQFREEIGMFIYKHSK